MWSYHRCYLQYPVLTNLIDVSYHHAVPRNSLILSFFALRIHKNFSLSWHFYIEERLFKRRKQKLQSSLYYCNTLPYKLWWVAAMECKKEKLAANFRNSSCINFFTNWTRYLKYVLNLPIHKFSHTGTFILWATYGAIPLNIIWRAHNSNWENWYVLGFKVFPMNRIQSETTKVKL